MKIEKNDMVMVYDGGGTVPHCKYTGRFGDLTAYWRKSLQGQMRLSATTSDSTSGSYPPSGCARGRTHASRTP